MFNADHFYCIGSSHHFCEDFAISEKSYAILSDGCSSAKQSMIGSMILSKTAELFIKKDSQEMINLTIETADIYRRILNITPDSLSATLLTVTTTENAFKATSTGDGVIVAKHKEKGLEYIDIEYTSGAPFYPKYKLSKEDLNLYLNKFPGEYVLNVNGELISKYLEYGCQTIEYIFPYSNYEFVGIMSDGCKTFYQEETKENISLKEIINEMFNFKGFQGEFVKRRTQKAFKNKYKHFDDFSIAVVVNYE